MKHVKKILFTINTMGHAGAETALIELLKRMENYEDCEIFLYVMLQQGEMIDRLPSYIHLLNKNFSRESVLSKKGQRRLIKIIILSLFRNRNFINKIGNMIKVFISMMKIRRIQADKLLWRLIAEGAPRFEETFDLAVAWIEGASVYYTADYVKADKKAAVVHIDYESAGYTRQADQECWNHFDKIFTVSKEVEDHFRAFYPEHASKLCVFPNFIDQEQIRRRAEEPGGFQDHFKGMRLLTVGRLTYQKAYDIAVESMKILKDSGCKVRWYVLGEGRERKTLEKKIASYGLQNDFILMGDIENPYPYYLQADIYVHATRFEGKSIAIQEAQTLGCAVIASDCNGNREQIVDGKDGILCELSPRAVSNSIMLLLKDEKMRKEFGCRAREKNMMQEQGRERMLLELLSWGDGYEKKRFSDYYSGI